MPRIGLGFRHFSLLDQFIRRAVRFIRAREESETVGAGADLRQRILDLLVVGRIGQHVAAQRAFEQVHDEIDMRGHNQVAVRDGERRIGQDFLFLLIRGLFFLARGKRIEAGPFNLESLPRPPARRP